MAIAVVLAILVIGTVLFHFMNPWQATDVASNWDSIDTILAITFAVSGLFFVAIMGFVVFCLIRYRHRPGRRADYEPENRKLEWWLIGITTVGICALLAPGLVVYDRFVKPPEDALDIEIFGEQWGWRYRLPGTDGQLGRTSVGHISPDNPLGLDPDDPAGQDDILVRGNTLYLPHNQPVRFLLRSRDVLHNFYVPQFRAKMDIVPGMVTTFWLTPTRRGRFEVLCAELCGVGHYNMRGHVVVTGVEEFDAWLASQATFADSLGGEEEEGLVAQGERLSANHGCLACHSVDGGPSLGPTWLDLYGSERILDDGRRMVADYEYLERSILDPNVEVVRGYPPVMPPSNLGAEQIEAVIAYIRSLVSTDFIPE